MLAAQQQRATVPGPRTRPAIAACARPRALRLRCHALKAGETLPDFRLESDTSHYVSSKDMTRDHGCVLFVYPQACTSGCTFQANGFKDNIRTFADKGYRVYGLSADPPAAQAGWKELHAFPFALLSDPSKAALSKLGVLGADGSIKRAHFVVAKGGVVEDAQVGISSKDSVPVALAFVATK